MFIKRFSSRPAKRADRNAGFTLVELMVVMALLGIASAMLLGASFYTGRSIASLADSVTLGMQSRSVVDRMSQKLRQAEAVTAYNTNMITVTSGTNTLNYTFSSGLRRLTETENGASKILLENCDSLLFELYKRNPVTNSFDQFPAANVLNEAKLVRVSWACATKAVGKSTGSSELVSAKIVLRVK
jgi:prepilin-type N-terminal cleavage/methylation domain-containing protein